jgi:hypothetical protein
VKKQKLCSETQEYTTNTQEEVLVTGNVATLDLAIYTAPKQREHSNRLITSGQNKQQHTQEHPKQTEFQQQHNQQQDKEQQQHHHEQNPVEDNAVLGEWQNNDEEDTQQPEERQEPHEPQEVPEEHDQVHQQQAADTVHETTHFSVTEDVNMSGHVWQAIENLVHDARYV